MLILVGGLVTNTGSALAVPDWPTTFGYDMFLYPWSRMVGGVLYEHGHRLIGSAVGMLTVAFALWLWFAEPRKWVRVLGGIAVLAVVAQGVIGGLRVLLLDNQLAIVHGCLAQAFFALMVTLAVCTSRWWLAAAHAEPLNDSRVRTMALATVALVYVQLVFGSFLTHTGGQLAAHLTFAGLVTVAITALAVRLLRRHPARPALGRPARWLLVMLVLQLGLGVGAYLWRFTALSASMPIDLGLALESAHRLNGTALWGTSVLLTLRILRLTAQAEPVAHTERARSSAVQQERQQQVLA